MKQSNIINRNFFRLLRAGAFEEIEDVEPMSTFKWKRLIQIADVQDVLPFIAQGFHRYESDQNLTVSPTLQQELKLLSSMRVPDVSTSTTAIEQMEPQLSNFFLKRKQKRLLQKELNSEEYSQETVQMLHIIIYNINQTLTKGISLNGIIEMGRYLRTKGNHVDFVKLEQWLHSLGVMRLASLQGSILIDIFHFDLSEIPFMGKEEKGAANLTQRSLTHTASDTAENWHFRMRTNGMVENNSRVLRRNLRRSVRYFRYNPFETTSNFLANFAKSLSEIEE